MNGEGSPWQQESHILVTNLPVLVGLSLSDKLQIYFGKRSNGGGDISDIRLLKPSWHSAMAALITFTEGETVRSVLVKEHVFYGRKLRVDRWRPPWTGELRPVQENETTSSSSQNGNIVNGIPQQNAKLVLNDQWTAAHLEVLRRATTRARLGVDDKTARFTLTGNCHEVVRAAALLATYGRNGKEEEFLPTEDREEDDDEHSSGSWSPQKLAIKTPHLAGRAVRHPDAAAPKMKRVEHLQEGNNLGQTKLTQQASLTMEKPSTSTQSRKLTNCAPGKSTMRPSKHLVRFDQNVLNHIQLDSANHLKLDEIRDRFKVDFQSKSGGVVEVSHRGLETNPQNIQGATEALKDLVVRIERRGLARRFFGARHKVEREIARLQESIHDTESADAVPSVVWDKGRAGTNPLGQLQDSPNQPGEADGEAVVGDCTLPPSGEQRAFLTEEDWCAASGAPTGLEAQHLPPCGSEKYCAGSRGAVGVTDEGIVGRVPEEILSDTSSSADTDDIWQQRGSPDLRNYVEEGADNDGNDDDDNNVLPCQTSPHESLVETPESPTSSDSVVTSRGSSDQTSTSQSPAPHVSFVYIPPDDEPYKVKVTQVHENPTDIGREAQNDYLSGTVPHTSADLACSRREEIETDVLRGPSTAVRSEVTLATDPWETASGISSHFTTPPVNHGTGCPHPELASGGDFSITLQTGMKLVIRRGNLTDEFTDVIVSSADPHLHLRDGVGCAVREAAGPELAAACRGWVQKHGPVQGGKSVWTTGGNLTCSHVLHVVLPGSGLQMMEILRETIVEALKTCTHKLEASMVSMPAMGRGRGVSRTACAHAFHDAVLEIARLYRQGWLRLDRLVLVDQDEATVDEFRQVFSDAVVSGVLRELVLWDEEEEEDRRRDRRRGRGQRTSWATEWRDNVYDEMAMADAWTRSPSSSSIVSRLRPRGPSQPVQTPPQTQDNKCSICLQEIRDEKKLKCGHSFCRSCIDTWLRCHDICAYCRQKV